MTLTLTGCVRLGIDLQVNKDKTMSGTMIFALSDSLTALGGSSSSLNQGSLIDPKTKGVTVHPYAKDGYTGEEYYLKDVPFSAFSPGGKSDSFTITETSKKITVNGYMDFSDTSGGGAFGSQLASSMMSSADIHISIRFPYDVTSSTGEISKDKRTVTWHPKIGEKTQLQAVVVIPSASKVTYLAAAIVLLLILVLLGLFLARRRKLRVLRALQSEMNEHELNPGSESQPESGVESETD
jgi:hypothetical protein